MSWTKITKKLLEAEPISGSEGWEKDDKSKQLKQVVQEFVREKLNPFKNKGLWVNIVALLIPEDPGKEVLSPDPVYKEAVKGALFLPVAVDYTKQTNLDKAYQTINKEERLEDSEKHLSYHVIKFQESNIIKDCYKFQRNSDGKIQTFSCLCSPESRLEEPFNDNGIYDNLFNLSKNIIWFLPHDIYHLPLAKPDLYKTHIVGVYLGTKNSGLCNLEGKECLNLKEILCRFAQMFYIKRRHDQDNIFYKEHERLWNESSRKIKMIEVIRKPLAALTQELEKTQENVQVLISVLDSPHRSLFNTAPQVQNYFDDREPRNFGNVKWVGYHKIDSAEKPEELHGVAATLCAIICHVLGAGKKKVNSETELYYLVKLLLKKDEDDIYHLRPTLRLILAGKSSAQSKEIHNFFSQLKCMLLQQDINDHSIIKEGLERLKYIVYTPFKFSGETPIIPLVLLFYDYGYRDKINYQYKEIERNGTVNTSMQLEEAIEKYLSKISNAKITLYNSKSIPVPRYSNILTFVSGLLAYMKSQPGGKGIKCISLNSTYSKEKGEIINGSMAIEFEKSDFFILNDIPSLFELMETVAKNELHCPQGNFRKPFIDFASLLGNLKIDTVGYITDEKGNFVVTDDSVSWIVLKNNWQTVLKISQNCFILETKRIEKDGN